MENKYLGKITSAYFGLGGYQDCQLGFHIGISYGGSFGSGISSAEWDYESIKCDEHCRWTEEDRDKNMTDMLRKLSKILKEAGVNRVEKLVGIPIEVIEEGMCVKSWRVLTEVL